MTKWTSKGVLGSNLRLSLEVGRTSKSSLRPSCVGHKHWRPPKTSFTTTLFPEMLPTPQPPPQQICRLSKPRNHLNPRVRPSPPSLTGKRSHPKLPSTPETGYNECHSHRPGAWLPEGFLKDQKTPRRAGCCLLDVHLDQLPENSLCLRSEVWFLLEHAADAPHAEGTDRREAVPTAATLCHTVFCLSCLCPPFLPHPHFSGVLLPR